MASKIPNPSFRFSSSAVSSLESRGTPLKLRAFGRAGLQPLLLVWPKIFLRRRLRANIKIQVARHSNIFVWNRYRGYQPGHIAEMLGWSSAEVEATLGEIHLILCRRTRALLAEDHQPTWKQVDLRVSRHRKSGATTFFV